MALIDISKHWSSLKVSKAELASALAIHKSYNKILDSWDLKRLHGYSNKFDQREWLSIEILDTRPPPRIVIAGEGSKSQNRSREDLLMTNDYFS